MSADPAVIQLLHADLGMGRVPTLRDVSCAVVAGEVVAVLGASGAGKSTLLASVAGTVALHAGTLTVHGRDPRTAPCPVGFVPQSTEGRYVSLCVEEIVALGRPHRGLRTSPADRARARQLLADLGLAGLEHRRLSTLSGGQHQRVAIARALAASDSVVLCDEPTSGADPILAAELVGVLTGLARRGAAVLIATHDLATVVPAADRVLGFASGRLVYDGPPLAASEMSELVYQQGAS